MWQIILCISFAFLILEMFTPGMFFLNFALSALFCAVLSLFTQNIAILTTVFCVLGVVFIFTLRPLFVQKFKNRNLETGMESKYVGKTAKVIEDIDKNKGAISLYDERWQARNVDEGIIEKDSLVEILSYDSLILYVRRK